MVGDGVNDVLAIKDADCGIAMAAGADAAKQAAHIVLLDSNFSSMKSIVKEGRTIIANIERVSSLYLTKTIYSTFLSLFFGLIGLTYPFTPFQLSFDQWFCYWLAIIDHYPRTRCLQCQRFLIPCHSYSFSYLVH